MQVAALTAGFLSAAPAVFTSSVTAQPCDRANSCSRRRVVLSAKKGKRGKKTSPNEKKPKAGSGGASDSSPTAMDAALPLDGTLETSPVPSVPLDMDDLLAPSDVPKSNAATNDESEPKRQRKRLRRREALGSSKRERENKESEGMEKEVPASDTDASVANLAKAFRLNSRETLLEIEKDPDYLFQPSVLNPSNSEYSLLSATLGRGSANKQGTYLLPYLQNGHLAILIATLVATFGYFPGFPLTELPEESRVILGYGLEINSSINLLLAIWAYVAAKKRPGQIPWFWSLKTLALGGLALDELRSNVPLDARGGPRSSK